jgi:predicted O-methyltransferase YrrM
MTQDEILKLVVKWPIDKIIVPDTEPWSSQFDAISAQINYALVREYKPKVVVEFGARGGRCTRDINRALLDNGGEFIFKSYELEPDNRKIAQDNLNNEFGDKAPILGGDIMLATDIPEGIDYLFVDNYHDEKTTKWTFEELIKKCKPGCLVQIHDIRVEGDYHFLGEPGGWGEMQYLQKMVDEKRFPLNKLYWSWEDKSGERSSSWWTLS